MNRSDYASLDGIGLANAVRDNDTTWREIAQAAIDAIDTMNPQLNAVVMRNFDNVLEAGPLGTSPLGAVPTLIKDCNVFTQDMPTTYSCPYFEGAAPRTDSTIVRRWRRAGLLMMGKSNLPEFAAQFVTEPRWRGTCHNPWNPATTTGGSSGGAAAAVASGMVPIAHATDLGGSIRIPAAACGVFGFKPTAGLNPVGPFTEIASGLNSDHVITRSVRDSAASLDITAGPDAYTRYQVPRSVPSYLDALNTTAAPLRIGVTDVTPDGAAIDPRQSRAVADCARLLEDAGHTLVPFVWPGDLEIDIWFEALWVVDVLHALHERAQEIGRAPGEHELEPLTRHMIDQVGAMSAMDLANARLNATAYASKLNAAQNDVDLLLTPSLAMDPPTHGSINGRDGDVFSFDQWAAGGYGFAPFSAPFNLTGQPAAVCPLSWHEGEMPLSVQIVGKSRADHVVLQIAALIEQAHPWQHRRPSLSVATHA